MRNPVLAAQFGLGLERAPSYARSAFTITLFNASAVRTLDAWPDWRGGAMVLSGPPGSGKTHLSNIWAERVGAASPPDDGVEAALAAGPVLVDDADRRLGAGEALFHLLNLAAGSAHGLLMTGAAPPAEWPASVPDLRSRLNALPTVALAEPDDAVLAAMLAKAFAERMITPADDLIPYLLNRIDRSAAAARAVVRQLDEAATARGGGVNRALARRLLAETGEAEEPS